MNNLFEESDFALFAQYANKTQSEAPEGQVKLRPIYDKLGKVLDVLQEKGYHTNIRRNPLTQAMKYCEYHWGQIYPKDYNHYKSCEGIVFVVIGSTKDGINIHIDSNSRNGFDSDNNKDAKAIKVKTWLEFSPQDVSHYSSEDLAQIVDDYFNEHWFEFNLFAKEFGVQESINILNQMKMGNIKELLLGNHNLILTGAPGTGKTYLAKQIAQQMIFGKVKAEMTPDEEKQFNEQCELVQFHPSYDYTDFVEGLRPTPPNEDGNVGFERKDGVFKEFCAKALDNLENSQKDESVLSKEFSVEKRYLWLLSQIENEEISEIPLKTNGKKLLVEKVSDFKNIILKAPNTTSSRTYTVSLKRILKLSKVYTDTNSLNAISNISVEVRNAIGGCNASAYWAVLNLLYKEQDSSSQTNALNNKVEKKDFVFIIDEINRGEINKIFGELFFSIDPGYRGKDGKVRTQYASMQEEPNDFDMALGVSEKCGNFFVPENVYIIGTMNDIDRSVESMDFAFRRRFAFKEIKANDEISISMLDSDNAWGKDENGNSLKPDNDAIEYIKETMYKLNDVIWHKSYENEEEYDKSIDGLSSAYHIGASYFLKLVNYKNDDGSYDFDKLWEYHLEGLLYEYLRGTTDVYRKLQRLAMAYGYTKAEKYYEYDLYNR